MPFDYDDLIRALSVCEKMGITWAELARATEEIGSPVSAATIGRTFRGQTKPQNETWGALSVARPDIIPPPPWRVAKEAGPKKPAIDGGPEITLIPVFNAGAGEPSSFTDEGYPVGYSSEYTYVDTKGIDENTFGVRAKGESMSPILNVGDTAVVVPSAPLSNGCICFAIWPDEKRLIKKYYKYGDTIVLRSEKDGEKEITLNSDKEEEVRIYRVKR